MDRIHWRTLTAGLKELTEADALRLLAEEKAQHKRPAIARRLHQRYCMLRMARERDELMKELSA
jgi:hypothetical protein